MRTALESLKELHAIQGNDGNWNYDSYSQGLYNGMELAIATLEDREPLFKEAPIEWLRDQTIFGSREAAVTSDDGLLGNNSSDNETIPL